jgi:hypothetical protein
MNVTFRVTPVQLPADPTALEPPEPAGILAAPDPAASPGEKSAIPADGHRRPAPGDATANPAYSPCVGLGEIADHATFGVHDLT